MSIAELESPVAPSPAARTIGIEFMYIDLTTCTRCTGTDANLDAAIAAVAATLDAAGVVVSVRKTLVVSEEQARALGFVSSPTIRVDGRDVALEFRQSRCADCEACACNGEVECRVWVWRGQEYDAAPPEMIVDAILRAAYAGAAAPAARPAPLAETPENLKRFFAGKARQEGGHASCCAPEEQASCCEPAAKASCCGTASAEGGCGCR